MAQSSICSIEFKHSIYIEATIKLNFQDDIKIFKSALKSFTDSIDKLQVQYHDSLICGSIGFSIDGWKKVTTTTPPSELISSNSLDYIPNVNQRDLIIHISSVTFDVAFKLVQKAIEMFGHTIKVEQEVHGFRRCEDRDLSNFIDGTNNLKTLPDKEKFSLIPAGQPHEFGSFCWSQRWVHHLENWEDKSLQYQQNTIGRMKKDSARIPVEQRPTNSHVSRTQLLDENGDRVAINRASLPYGLASGEKGLFFISFSNKVSIHKLMLESMFGKKDSQQDLILKFTVPVSGSLYFIPSKDELINL